MTAFAVRVMWKKTTTGTILINAESHSHARARLREGLSNGTIQPPEPGMEIDFIPEVTEVTR